MRFYLLLTGAGATILFPSPDCGAVWVEKGQGHRGCLEGKVTGSAHLALPHVRRSKDVSRVKMWATAWQSWIHPAYPWDPGGPAPGHAGILPRLRERKSLTPAQEVTLCTQTALDSPSLAVSIALLAVLKVRGHGSPV